MIAAKVHTHTRGTAAAVGTWSDAHTFHYIYACAEYFKTLRVRCDTDNDPKCMCECRRSSSDGGGGGGEAIIYNARS